MSLLTNNRIYALLLCLTFIFLLGGCKTTTSAVDENNPLLLKPEDKLPVDPAITRGKLENGLAYLIRRNTEPEKRAEFRLVVNAGSILERENEKGIAHFVEHMAFNGTKNFRKQEIVNFLESVGMRFGPELNAFTSFNETVYILKIPTENDEILETALKILADWACNMLIEEEEVEKERGIIIEEWRMRKNAEARLSEKQYPFLFYGSRYPDRMPIGDIGIIETCDAELLRGFYERWYRPDLMSVIAVGDFKAGWMEEKIKEYFSGMKSQENAPERFTEVIPDHEETLINVATDPEATSYSINIYLKHDVLPSVTVGDYRVRMIANLVHNIIDERLSDIARTANAPFTEAYAGYAGNYRSKEFTVIGATVKEGRIIDALDTLLVEAERAKRYGFTETEINRQKERLITWIESIYNDRGNRNSADFAEEYIRHFLVGESIPGIEYEQRIYKQFLPGVSLKEINGYAETYMTEDNRVVLVEGPEKEDIRLPDKKMISSRFEAVKEMEIFPYIDTVTEKPLISGKLEEKAIINRLEIPKLGVTQLTLSNGVTVVLKQTDFKDDEVLFSAYSPGGHSLVPDKEFIAASTAAALVHEGGLDGFSLTELEKLLAGKNVHVIPWINELNEGIEGSSVPEDLETCFKLIYLSFTQPRMDANSFETYKERKKAEIQDRASSPERVFWDTVWEVLSQDNLRREPLTVEKLGEMDMKKSLEFYRDRFGDASDFTFFFVGNFRMDVIEPLIKTYLGNLPATDREETWKDLNIDPPAGVVLKDVRKGIEPKSQVLLTYSGDATWSYEGRIAINALSEVFNIRLREVIREKEGGSYDIWAFTNLQHYPDEEYYIYIGFGCAPEKAERLSDLVIEEIERIKIEGPTPQELQKTKEILKREYETNIKENNYWLTMLQTMYVHKLDPLTLLDYMESVESLTAETLRNLAVQYCKSDRYARVILYPEKE
ncbi:MAG: insulinase family protein [Spirochaetales bacterium]|nr:insulinase family protein [Spirochaetales bacterium]